MFACIALIIMNLPFIENGDQSYRQQQYADALQWYERALSDAPNDAQVLWRIARTYVTIGDVAPREERESYYRKADVASERAVRADSLNANAHCWRAITVGYVSMYEGVRSKVKMSRIVKQELDEAIRLDPRNDIAYSVLGTFYRAIGNISWLERQFAGLFLGGVPEGGFAEGEAALKKAVALAPDIVRHRYELGRLYLDWGKPEDARKVFAAAVGLAPNMASDTRRIEFMKRKLSEER